MLVMVVVVVVVVVVVAVVALVALVAVVVLQATPRLGYWPVCKQFYYSSSRAVYIGSRRVLPGVYMGLEADHPCCGVCSPS